MAKNCRYLFIIGFYVACVSSMAQEDENQAIKSKLPIGTEVQLSNNIGASTFSNTYKQDPLVTSTVDAYPYYKIPLPNERELKIHGELSTSLEWMGQGNPFPGKFGDKFDFGDGKLRAEFKNALFSKSLGLSLSPALELEAPFSKAARQANRIVGLGGFVNAAWTMWGFSASLKPVAIAYTHTNNYNSGDCTSDSTQNDELGNGQCKLPGRQAQVLLKTTLSTGYSKGNHSLTVALRTYHSFLRKPDNGEKPDKVLGSNVTEATKGYVEYAYNLGLNVPTQLILGVSGYQAAYDIKSGFRVPFFDFTEPAKNQTEAYVALNVTI